ncbi:MAG: mechanosensitive ion channel family protein [Gemmatimonadota bacterium]|nr:mechanosensitive ion channel family protein [Gemmatimonadota bacterium]
MHRTLPYMRRLAGGGLLAVVASGIVPLAEGPGRGPRPLVAQEAVADPQLPTTLDSLVAAIARLERSQDSLIAELAGRRDSAAASLGAVPEGIRGIGLRTAVSFLILILAFGVVRLASWILDRLAERNATRRLLYKRLVPIVRVFIWAATVVVVLRVVFGLEARTLLAAGAAIGVAIGFAAQDILKNIFGGLVIIGDRPFQVGDKISVEGTYGEVTAIGLRSTRIVTPDDSLVTVPNAQIVDGQVSNANSGALDCQVVTDLYLPGWVDTRRAQEIAYSAAVTSRFVYLKKPVVVLVKDQVSHTFLTHLRVKAYVSDIRHEFKFMSDVTQRAREAFVEAGLLPAWHGALAHVVSPGDAPGAGRPTPGTDEGGS